MRTSPSRWRRWRLATLTLRVWWHSGWIEDLAWGLRIGGLAGTLAGLVFHATLVTS